MATLAELENSYKNPNVQQFLKIIADAEGVKYGYNTMFGNSYFANLAQHPNKKIAFKEKDGSINYTTAAGAYQFLYSTWSRLKNAFGFKNFSGKNQDLAAIALIAENNALNDVKAGNFRNAINKLGGVWASLPSSQYKATQPSKTWGQIGMPDNQDKNQQSQQGLKKYLMDLPAVKALAGGILAANTIATNEDGVLAGAGQVGGAAIDAVGEYLPNPAEYIAGAGNFALRSVVILSAVGMIAIGFYFMFKQEITETIKAVTK